MSEHATNSRNILRLTKAAVFEPNPFLQCPLVPTFPLTGVPGLWRREKTGLMAGVGEGKFWSQDSSPGWGSAWGGPLLLGIFPNHQMLFKSKNKIEPKALSFYSLLPHPHPPTPHPRLPAHEASLHREKSGKMHQNVNSCYLYMM